MKINMVGAFVRNFPHGSEIAFAKGLQAEEFEDFVDVRTIDSSREGFEKYHRDPDATIIFKWVEGDHRKFIEDLPGKKIVYQPDDLYFPHIQEEMKEMSKFCPNLFIFAPNCAAQGKAIFETSSLLRLTADPSIYYTSPLTGPKDFDVCFVANISNEPGHRSRRLMAETVQGIPGLKTFIGCTFDVKTVRQIYARSKIVLHHATDIGQEFGYGYGYQCRHFEAGMVGSCLLSNFVLDETGIPRECFPVFSSMDSLVFMIKQLLSDDKARQIYARKLWEEVGRNHDPVTRADQILKLIDKVCV